MVSLQATTRKNVTTCLHGRKTKHAGTAEIYPWHSGPRRRQEQPDGTEQGLNGISEPQILRQNL